jgi:putative ABC transport system permease protein
MSLLSRANRRHFVRHPLQLLLAMLGVALGVAMVVSIDLAARSTHRAFSLSMEALTGRYTHHIEAVGSGGLPESLFTRLRVEAGLRETAPAVEGYVSLDNRTLRLVGFDVLSERNLRSRFVSAARGDEGRRLLTEPDAVLLSAVTARRLGIRPGDVLEVLIDSHPQRLEVVGYAEGGKPPDPALEGVILADIATAQERLGKVGWLDRIDLVLGDDPREEGRVRALLPPGVELNSAAGRRSATQNMTAAFELNLRAMSLLALLVGSFLIYNTMAFSVLQRRELLASLRVLGATSRQLLIEILLEAAVLGLLGGLAGLGLGVLAARGLLHMVTRTINDIYFVLTVSEFLLDPWVLVYGLALGVIVAVLAALGPAIEAALTAPVLTRARSGAEDAARRALPWLALAGLLALPASAGLLLVDLPGLAPAIAGVFLMLLGYGLLSPVFLVAGVSVAGGLARIFGGWLPRLAVRGVGGTLSRSGLAIAALTIAVAVSIGVGAMIESFRGSIAEWLEQILQADIYLTMPSSTPRSSPPLPEGLAERLASIPGVDRIGMGRRLFISTNRGESELMALDPPYLDKPGFRFKDVDGRRLWAEFPTLRGLLISEPYAQRHGLRVGDRIEIGSGVGTVSLPVAGIFFDYRSDQGLIVMHRRLYDQLWHDAANTSLGLYLKPGADVAAARAELERRLADIRQPLNVRSNREIRDISLETFERTFAITQVLRLLAVGVAFIGIVSALLALQVERGRELAVLRATGLTPAQIGGLVLLQTGFMGLMAGLLAIPLGLAVAVALVRVINLRSFGWTMDLTISLPPLLLAVALSMLAALLAGLYPARQAMRTPPAAGLREE